MGPCQGVPLNNQPYDKPCIKESLLGEVKGTWRRGRDRGKGERKRRERGRQEEVGQEHLGKREKMEREFVW